MTDQAIQDDTAETQTCPRCAETVKAAALVCRYCGHEFEGAASAQSPVEAPPHGQKSVAGSRVLSFLLAGIGHFYVRENARGALFLASNLAAAFSYALGAENPLAISLVVTIAAIVDAGRGAENVNAGRQPRGPSGGLWGMLAIAYVVAVLAANLAPRQDDALTTDTDTSCLTTDAAETLCGYDARAWCSSISPVDLGTARACRSVGWSAPEEPEINEFGDPVAAPKPKAPAVPEDGGTIDQCAEQGYDRLSCIAQGWK